MIPMISCWDIPEKRLAVTKNVKYRESNDIRKEFCEDLSVIKSLKKTEGIIGCFNDSNDLLLCQQLSFPYQIFESGKINLHFFSKNFHRGSEGKFFQCSIDSYGK